MQQLCDVTPIFNVMCKKKKINSEIAFWGLEGIKRYLYVVRYNINEIVEVYVDHLLLSG